MSNLLKMMAGAGIAAPLYVDDVFSAYTYTGNGSTQTITNGIDLAGEGGMVWVKSRGPNTRSNHLFDTTRSAGNYILSDTTAAATTNAAYLSSFSSAGFSLGLAGDVNSSADTFVSWTFRNAPNFFNHSSVVKSSGSNATVSFPDLTTLGMVAVKRTDSTGSWYVWHRSLTAGKLLYLEQTAAEATLGHITVSGTTVTLVNGVIADGTYIVYAWAHDDSADGIIQCGSFTTDGAGASSPVVLNWEEQFLIIKNITGAENWYVFDTQRGFSLASNSAMLRANLSNAENVGGIYGSPTATGFALAPVFGTSQTYIYLAIRRPNKPPTVGTQVYNAIARTGTGAAATVTGVGFAPDLHAVHSRSGTTGGRWEDRLRGATQELVPETTAAEAAVAQSVISFGMDGSSIGTDGDWNTNTATYINWFFRRAPGFFDEVCYTGNSTNRTVEHSLSTIPELLICKNRTNNNGNQDWQVYHAALGNTARMKLNLTDAIATGTSIWNSATPTSAVFSLGTSALVNGSGDTYVAYLFATLAGISKVGSYTGTAAALQINCGFTTGARFVLIKRTDSTGDWYVWDTVRGIIAGNDPYLLLNSTAAEVTTTDYIDPYSAGFEISSTAPAAINASGGTYIFLAIA